MPDVLARHCPAPLAFVISQCLFIGYHLQIFVYSWAAALSLLSLSLGAAWLKKESQSLGPCIVMRMSYNLVMVIAISLGL